jgi:hypothetical protein
MRLACTLVIAALGVLLVEVCPVASQQARPAAPQQVREEVLPPILIVTVVEKPSVAILPKRIKPEFKAPLFVERSFERELRELPFPAVGVQEELESAKKIRRLEKLLLREKK